jgi:hypothetical protein
MNRSRSLIALACIVGVSCAWMTMLRADDANSTKGNDDPVAQLLGRIEALERRVEALEGNLQAAQQVDSILVPAGGWLTAPNVEPKPRLSHGTLIVPPKPERSGGGVFLPHHIEFVPE